MLKGDLSRDEIHVVCSFLRSALKGTHTNAMERISGPVFFSIYSKTDIMSDDLL